MDYIRFYRKRDSEAYVLVCLYCNECLWQYVYALETRHLEEVAAISTSHVCSAK